MARKASRAAEQDVAERWVAQVAHELRGPLQPLYGFLGLVRRRGTDDADLIRSLEAAERQFDLLQRLLNDLSAPGPGRWTSDRSHMTGVAMGALVQQALECLSSVFSGRRQVVLPGIRPGSHCVYGDAERLMQVLLNLLSNASKFSPDGGLVRVTVDSDESQVILEVRDNGRGLAAGEQHRIFRLFARGQAAVGTSGSGIGLAVVQQFVAMHGGHVQASSNGPGHGAVFTVRLPRMLES